MQLEGTGILSKYSSCYVYAEGFKLHPHSIGRTTVNLAKAHVVLPNIENVLKFSEEVVLQPNAASAVNLQRLEAIASRVTSRNQLRGTDVARMVDALTMDGTDGQPRSWIWFLCVIIISAIIGSLWSV
jgi:hypothetical protein